MINKIIYLAIICPILLLSHIAQANGNRLSGEVRVLNNEGQPMSYRGNVIVFLEPKTASGQYQPPSEDIVISQRGRRFRPSVLPVIKGTSLAFPNDDRVLHNVFSLSKTEPFDLGNYNKGESRSIKFDKPGRVKVYCNIHPKMTSNILVLNNDFYTKPNDDGSFIIKNIPLGHYILRVWHELAEAKQYNIEIKEGENTLDKLSLPLTKRYIQHKTKFGKNYKSKY